MEKQNLAEKTGSKPQIANKKSRKGKGRKRRKTMSRESDINDVDIPPNKSSKGGMAKRGLANNTADGPQIVRKGKGKKRRNKKKSQSDTGDVDIPPNQELLLEEVTLHSRHPVKFEIDTASADSFITVDTWEKIGCPRLSEPKTEYLCASNQKLAVHGIVNIPVSINQNQRSCNIQFNVTREPGLDNNLLGLTAIQTLKLSVDQLLSRKIDTSASTTVKTTKSSELISSGASEDAPSYEPDNGCPTDGNGDREERSSSLSDNMPGNVLAYGSTVANQGHMKEPSPGSKRRRRLTRQRQ